MDQNVPEHNLERLLTGMTPSLDSQRYVFVSLSPDTPPPGDLQALMRFEEEEGTSLILERASAEAQAWHSSFHAAGSP